MPYQPNVVDFQRRYPQISIRDFKEGVLVRSPNWLGDVMMCLAATWQLRTVLPADVPLWILSPAGLSPIWNAAPWVDGVVPFAGHHPNADELQSLKEREFGLGVVLPNSFGTALEMWRAGIPQRLGRRGNLRRLLLTDSIPRWVRDEGVGKWHQLSYYLELVNTVGKVEFTAERPDLEVDPEPAADLGIRKGDGWLALSPGANYGPAKQWPAKCYQEVAEAWLKQGGKVLLVGTPKERPLTAAIAGDDNRMLNLAGKTNLTELMSVLANVDHVVANDSGSMHLAAGCGTPGIALFASTDPVGTGPLGAPWETLTAEVPCRPCFKRHCTLPTQKQYQCMTDLTTTKTLQLLIK